MKKISLLAIIVQFLLFPIVSSAQSFDNQLKEATTTPLFEGSESLDLKLKYSVKEIKKETNDSTYMISSLSYKGESNEWVDLEVNIRVRGNSRLANCHYPPIKLKLSKSITKGTLFEGNKKLKLVVPCLIEKEMNDNVVQEYLAYKIYEKITPVHYKTKLVNLTFEEIKGKKIRTHNFVAFLIEDIDNVADRLNANEIKRRVHPLQQEARASVINSFFQFFIGNTDYSTMYKHNERLLFIDKKIVPIPYDFDMSGLVDASYAVVSNIQNVNLDIDEVTERAYKGYERDLSVFQSVRTLYLNKKNDVLNELVKLESNFKNKGEYNAAEYYLSSFYKILEDNGRFERLILNKARPK